MTVVMVQHLEGNKVGEHEIAPPRPGDDDPKILERKAVSHEERGWRIRWDQDGGGFNAQKVYPRFGRKERSFRVIEG